MTRPIIRKKDDEYKIGESVIGWYENKNWTYLGRYRGIRNGKYKVSLGMSDWNLIVDDIIPYEGNEWYVRKLKDERPKRKRNRCQT